MTRILSGDKDFQAASKVEKNDLPYDYDYNDPARRKTPSHSIIGLHSVDKFPFQYAQQKKRISIIFQTFTWLKGKRHSEIIRALGYTDKKLIAMIGYGDHGLCTKIILKEFSTMFHEKIYKMVKSIYFESDQNLIIKTALLYASKYERMFTRFFYRCGGPLICIALLDNIIYKGQGKELTFRSNGDLEVPGEKAHLRPYSRLLSKVNSIYVPKSVCGFFRMGPTSKIKRNLLMIFKHPIILRRLFYIRYKFQCIRFLSRENDRFKINYLVNSILEAWDITYLPKSSRPTFFFKFVYTLVKEFQRQYYEYFEGFLNLTQQGPTSLETWKNLGPHIVKIDAAFYTFMQKNAEKILLRFKNTHSDQWNVWVMYWAKLHDIMRYNNIEPKYPPPSDKEPVENIKTMRNRFPGMRRIVAYRVGLLSRYLYMLQIVPKMFKTYSEYLTIKIIFQNILPNNWEDLVGELARIYWGAHINMIPEILDDIGSIKNKDRKKKLCRIHAIYMEAHMREWLLVHSKDITLNYMFMVRNRPVKMTEKEMKNLIKSLSIYIRNRSEKVTYGTTTPHVKETKIIKVQEAKKDIDQLDEVAEQSAKEITKQYAKELEKAEEEKAEDLDEIMDIAKMLEEEVEIEKDEDEEEEENEVEIDEEKENEEIKEEVMSKILNEMEEHISDEKEKSSLQNILVEVVDNMENEKPINQ